MRIEIHETLTSDESGLLPGFDDPKQFHCSAGNPYQVGASMNDFPHNKLRINKCVTKDMICLGHVRIDELTPWSLTYQFCNNSNLKALNTLKEPIINNSKLIIRLSSFQKYKLERSITLKITIPKVSSHFRRICT